VYGQNARADGKAVKKSTAQMVAAGLPRHIFYVFRTAMAG
jgi:hypothetical protein